MNFTRSNSKDPDFLDLVQQLDADLAERDGKDHDFYRSYNTLEEIQHIVLAYIDHQAVGCGALKRYENDIMEIKRMYTLPSVRGRGVASGVLRELETWARELGYEHCILETGKKQPEAIHLYRKAGYTRIPNYGQYKDVENSVCFSKNL